MPDENKADEQSEPITTTTAELKAELKDAVSGAMQELADQVQATGDKIEAVAQQVQSVQDTLTETVTPTTEVPQTLIAEPPIVTTPEKLQEAVTVAVQATMEATTTLPTPPANGKPETVAVKHLASASRVNAYNNTVLTLIIAAGMVAFALLYSSERSKNTQLVEKYEKIIAEMSQTIRDLSKDLVSSQLVNNENIEVAIQKEIDRLTTEGMSKAQAIPRAYIDDQVIEEAIRYLPTSVLKQTYVRKLITDQLHDISTFAAKELQKESLPLK